MSQWRKNISWDLAEQLIEKHSEEISSEGSKLDCVVSVSLLVFNHDEFIEQALEHYWLVRGTVDLT